jgi:hypothetical protein
MNSAISNHYLMGCAVVLDKDEFVKQLGYELNSVQLKSLILCLKYGLLKYMMSEGKNKEHLSGALIRRNGGACLAFTIRKTIIHYDISRLELIEALEEAKKLADQGFTCTVGLHA